MDGHFVRVPTARPRRPLVDGDRIAGRLHLARGPAVVEGAGEAVLELGVEGIKADDGEGYYFPPDVRFADGRTGAEAAWDYGELYRRTMQEALDEVHPGDGVLFGRSGWSGQQATGMFWGGDQASDFWSLRTLVAATLTAAASGFSNWSHDVGGYLGSRLVERCPRGAAAALGPIRMLHAADAGARPLRAGGLAIRPDTLETYRDYVCPRATRPYIRAAAAPPRERDPDHPPARLTDPGDPRRGDLGRLWLRPGVLGGAGARGGASRASYLPRGDGSTSGRASRSREVEC